MTTIKFKTSSTSPSSATVQRQSALVAKGTAGRLTNPFDVDALERSPGSRSRLDSLSTPSFANPPELGSFKLNDLLNGLVPTFGTEIEPPGSGRALAPGLDAPQSITEPSLGEMGFGVANMGHSVDAAAAGGTDLGGVIKNWVTAAAAGTAAIGAATGSILVAGGGAAFAAGYALGDAIDSQITYSTGQSLGEAIYDATHGESEQSTGGKSESSDAGSAPAGTQQSESDQETESSSEDSEDAGTGESTGSTEQSSNETSESDESSDANESADAGTSDSGEKASSEQEAESGRDPELPYRYRPSYGEIQSSFGETAVATTARANPNPNAEAASEVDTQRTLTGSVDVRLVNEDGRAGAVGTVDAFGSTMLSTLGTIRPSGEQDDRGVPAGGRFGGGNPAA